MDALVFHEYEYESSVELDASVLATIPSLLSSSVSFDDLSSVCCDSDPVPPFSSVYSSKSFDIDDAITDASAFPFLLSSSSSFELNIGNVSDAWELETNVLQLQPKNTRTTRPKKQLRELINLCSSL